MDGPRFDDFARKLAGQTSRRRLLKGIAGGAGGGLLGLLGFGAGGVGTAVLVAGAATKLKISARPKATFDGLRAIVTWSTNQPADTRLRYGRSASLDQEVFLQEASTDHRVVLTGLEPGKRYYFQASSSNLSETVTATRATFTAPKCSSKKVACGDVCVSACARGSVLDPATCECGCPAGSSFCGDRCVDVAADPDNCGDCGITCEFDNAVGVCASATCVIDHCNADFADCDGDPNNGCETPLGTVDNCTACGDRCDDGNACTANSCDPTAGCAVKNVEDGTVCGTAGTCQNGSCVECVAGGSCGADKDCCDDELCCDGSCVVRAAFDDDPANCGACGNACAEGTTCKNGACTCPKGQTLCGGVCVDTRTDPANCDRCGNVCAAPACQTATCAAGVCGTAPAKDGTSCDDGNACTENDHCMAGACMGTAVADGTTCGEGVICADATCVAAPVCVAVGESCAAGIAAEESPDEWATGTANTADATAEASTATSPCCDGLVCCNGTCIDPKTDANHCGGCGIACPDGKCVDGECPVAQADSAPSMEAGGDRRTILASYNFRTNGTTPYNLTAYRPRQFANGFVILDPTRGNQRIDNAGPYAGWDVLPTINDGVRRITTWPDWVQLRLNRPAVLAIVWRGGTTKPSWLDAWTKAADIVVNGKTLPTFTKSFNAGAVNLGGVYNPGDNLAGGRDTYWILFAEGDGKRAAPPPVPSGLEVPQPNQTCPSWVHDRYVTTGPDGRTYSTWHNQIDPIHWCYFRHEHGSDPAYFGATYTNAFGYTATAHGMDEPHAGFKNLTFVSGGVRWWIMIHFGTGGLKRACARFHTLEVSARNDATGEVLADLHLMADYGKSVVNAGDAPLTPPACPNQAGDAAGSTGIRKLPAMTGNTTSYEPWRPDFRRTILGLSGSLVVNTYDPMVICNNSVCDQGVTTGTSGSLRFLDANGFTITAGGKNAGTFYTDPMGQSFLAAGAAGAVRQYIKPGLSLVLQHGDKCRDMFAWGQPYICTAAPSEATNREGSLRIPN